MFVLVRPPKDHFYDFEAEDSDVKTDEKKAKGKKRVGELFLGLFPKRAELDTAREYKFNTEVHLYPLQASITIDE